VTDPLQHVPEFVVHQKVTPVTNKYRIMPAGSDKRGPLLAFAQQKKMKLKEEVHFYSEEDRADLLFSFKSRQKLDLHATSDIMDLSGNVIATFTKDFGKSLVKSTWHLDYGDVETLGAESSTGKAIFRRVIDVPVRFDFAFVDKATDKAVMHVGRDRSLKDKYTVTVPDERLPFAVAAAMTVALDAFQGR